MDSQEAVAAENIMLLIEFCHGIRHTLKMVGYFRIFSPGQPAVLLSERQESFDSVCCRHAGSGVTRPCIRTSDKASCLWQQRAKKVLHSQKNVIIYNPCLVF